MLSHDAAHVVDDVTAREVDELLRHEAQDVIDGMRRLARQLDDAASQIQRHIVPRNLYMTRA